jgi:hypothetical protein
MAASGSGSAVDKIAGITDEMSKRSKLVGLENEQIELAKKLAQAKETEINYSDKLAVALSLQQESQIDVAAGMSRMSEWYDRLREARSKNTTLSIEDSREMEKDSQLLSAAMTRENARREDAIKLEEMAIRLGQPLHDVAQRTYDDNLKLASSYGAYSAVLSDLLVKRKKLAEMAALYQKTGGKQGMSPTEVQTAGVAQEMQALDVKLASGAGTWGEAMIAALGKVAAGFTTFKEGVGNIMGDLFKTMTDGFADSLGRAIVYSEDLGQSLKNLAKDALAQLISSFVKLMIQMTAARLVAAALGIDLAKLGGGSAAQGAAGFDWKGALINAAVSGIGAGIGGALGGGTGGYNGWTGATGSTGAIAADMSGMRFANGGGILSPIPQGLYTSETTFPMATLGRHAFARGGALTGIGKLGEAGPEFVMPAVQMANGKLGVAASGQSKAPEVKVVVNNTVAHDTEARVTQDSNGGLTLDIVRAAVAQDLYKGGTKIAKAADHAALRRGR